MTRKFPLALDLGAHTGHIYELITSLPGGVNGIEHLVQTDMSEQALLRGARRFAQRAALSPPAHAVGTDRLVVDEEFLPFAPGSFDLALSALSLHWCVPRACLHEPACMSAGARA